MNVLLPTLADWSAGRFELWALSMVRISFLIFLLPLISSREVPSTVKAGLSLMMSILIFPSLEDQSVSLPSGPAAFFGLAVREAWIGIVMGFAFSFVFSSLRMAGRWIDQETGFSVVQMFNPLTMENDTAMGQFLYLIFGATFFLTGAHLFYIQTVAESFQFIPLVTAEFSIAETVTVFLKLTGIAFIIGLKIAAPVISTIFISSLGLGVVARIMPQINVWFVGMPLKIGLGVIVVSITLPLTWQLFISSNEQIHSATGALLRVLGP